MTRPPTIVAASAGSGKTYRLTQEVTRSISPDAPTPVPLEGLFAVTYTRKAEAELAARIRRSLIEAGAFDAAARLPVAYLGTVHSVCMRLHEEFALDAGLSPYLEVLPDDGGRRLRAAIEAAVDSATLARLDVLARRLEISVDSRDDRHDWIRRVAEIMDLARANRIAPSTLPAMALRSSAGLLALLPPAHADGVALDQTFTRSIEAAICSLADNDDGTRKTRDENGRLRQTAQRLRQGDRRWSDWARAAKCEPGAASRPSVEPLVEAAGQYVRHPALHADLHELITTLFEVARLALDGYAAWKAARRMVDYIDMIDRALALVETPEVAVELATRIALVVVDEFQDTSPLQLALFTRLHGLGARSVWVGDGKQCIFEYAGADPMLMDAVAEWVKRQHGSPERLDRNYRSRPELVAAYAALFDSAFGDVRSDPVRAVPAEMASTPPFAVWWLETLNVSGEAAAIAEATASLLAEAHRTPIVDRVTGAVRAVAPRDVGILVATNAEARKIASEMQRRGLRAGLARDGLMATPEGVLIEAALRWVIAPRDLSALATLEALGEWNGLGPDAWLASKLREPAPAIPSWLLPLADLHDAVALLSPAELLDRAIHVLDAPGLCARWPDPDQRVGNLDALRALAARYEERCARARDVATGAGLVRYFDEARRMVTTRDGERATDDQFVDGDGDAVTITTYHRAKGLEWPVVVMASLDRGDRRDAFDPCPESEGDEFDPDDPLRGRWIRFWPWPFGRLRALPLAEWAAASPEGQRVAERERRERLRLLYVGFTRARDHLVLAIRLGKTAKTDWLDELIARDGAPLLGLPVDAAHGADSVVTVGASTYACRVTRVDGSGYQEQAARSPRRFSAQRRPAQERPDFRLAPSQAAHDAMVIPSFRVQRVRRIGPALSVPRETNWEALGNAVHGFLAADVTAEDQPARVAIARRLIARLGLVGVLEQGWLLAIAGTLEAVVNSRWPGAQWGREVPISARIVTPDGMREIAGTIDLLLSVGGGVVLIDHKTYPAENDAAVARQTKAFLPQLSAYAAALEACDHHVLACCVHFPVAGAWVDLARVDR